MVRLPWVAWSLRQPEAKGKAGKVPGASQGGLKGEALLRKFA